MCKRCDALFSKEAPALDREALDATCNAMVEALRAVAEALGQPQTRSLREPAQDSAEERQSSEARRA